MSANRTPAPKTISSSTPVNRSSAPTRAASEENQQIQQKLWVKEQEVAALKVQNRHLIAKLENAEKSAQPNQINTQKVASEIQNQLRPLIGEIEKSLVESFDILKSTMRGIYQQSQRAQQSVEEIGAHSREVETRLNEQRKADQVYYQEKILSMVTSFGDRIERQLENRLRNLAIVELMNTKQNEVLADVEMLKTSIAELVIGNEGLRAEIRALNQDHSQRSQASIDKIAEIFSDSKQMKIDAIREAQETRNALKNHVQSAESGAETIEIEDVPSENGNPPRITLDYL